MSDEDSALVRRLRRVVDTTQGRAAKLQRPMAWARDVADRLIVPRLEAQLDRLLRSMLEPRNARRLQSVLASVTQRGMELGFGADPQAAQLYEFVTWLEGRHGRPPVLLRVVEHAQSTEANFLRTLDAVLNGYGEPRGSDARNEAARRLHEIRDDVADELLALLTTLAELEAEEEAGELSVEGRVAFFEAAGLPEEFRDLSAMAAGVPGAFDSPDDEAAEVEHRDGGLTRFVPSFDDPHLRFLALSHLFFLQSYLARNLIELLPDLLQEAAEPVEV